MQINQLHNVMFKSFLKSHHKAAFRSLNLKFFLLILPLFSIISLLELSMFFISIFLIITSSTEVAILSSALFLISLFIKNFTLIHLTGWDSEMVISFLKLHLNKINQFSKYGYPLLNSNEGHITPFQLPYTNISEDHMDSFILNHTPHIKDFPKIANFSGMVYQIAMAQELKNSTKSM